jgi:CTP:molybdopterin cytidylyltransferase MocA
VLVDLSGRDQYLCASYSVRAIEHASASGSAGGHGVPMRDLVRDLRLARVPAVGDEAQDLDTWEDLARLREACGEGHS